VRIGGSEADPRFAMLATIRDFAAAKLEASGRLVEVERRHASFFLSLAEAAEPHLRGNPGPWLGRLETEHDNLRAALDRLARGQAVAPGDTSDAPLVEARLAGALWRFWYLAGHLDEGRGRLEHALAVHRDRTSARIKTLIGAAVMAQNAGDPDAASERAAEALELSWSTGDPWSAAYAQFMLANVASSRGEGNAARELFEESVRAFRELGDEHSAMLAARGLAGTLLDAGERDAARALYQDNLRRARAAANARLEASTLGALASIAFDEGRVTDATLLLRESLRLHRELRDRLDSAVDLARAARTLAIGGQPAEAAQLLGLLGAIREELGIRGRLVRGMADGTRASLLRQLPPAELDRLIDDGSRLRLEDAVELALGALG
jgi:tetratricopeptide (TPR) repeat protein